MTITCARDSSLFLAAAGLDPLHADALCAEVPSLNASSDVAGLVDVLRRLVAVAGTADTFTAAECVAATRDLGLLLGSIRRHGPQPLAVVPAAVQTLLFLGARTGMVPRDTVLHYGPGNPQGPRRRRYVGGPAEDAMIESVRRSAPAVEDFIELLLELTGIDPGDPLFAEVCARTEPELDTLIAAMDLIREHVPPAFFAQEMRPYFEPVDVGGRSYLGPAPAQLPLYLADTVLWASDQPVPGYAAFQSQVDEYNTPLVRSRYAARQGTGSLVSRLVGALRESRDPSPALWASVEGVRRILRRLIVFRGRHLTYARRTDDDLVRLFHHGSAGHTVDLPAEVLLLTREYRDVLARHGSAG
ncbi:DUF1864 family protein [Herbidospora sp. NEAU-GS84]|uniref:DUF1864 family protein n=1 Tax=Herbidospora solisilvae TaxID=2696284 RepID=A0A7C9J7H4_9ACTN|nr:monodechloroaminopyrrolnitrin synthase PrnB family protein [Herbidospora solisilvae]NAS25940.1 DUF1864 family protein [Herbidospora solisilvae]